MKKKILVVDDNRGDQVLIKETLLGAGVECEIIAADTGEEGIEKVKTENPDIVVLDTRLPKMDGFETCKKIKEIEQGKIKVIVMTGVIDAVDAVKAREANADDYSVKTSDCKSLIDVIKRFI